jgi:hypothetical protein
MKNVFPIMLYIPLGTLYQALKTKIHNLIIATLFVWPRRKNEHTNREDEALLS